MVNIEKGRKQDESLQQCSLVYRLTEPSTHVRSDLSALAERLHSGLLIAKQTLKI
jgi:hypothetical protein